MEDEGQKVVRFYSAAQSRAERRNAAQDPALAMTVKQASSRPTLKRATPVGGPGQQPPKPVEGGRGGGEARAGGATKDPQ